MEPNENPNEIPLNEMENPLIPPVSPEASSLDLQALASGINNSVEKQSQIVSKLSDDGRTRVIERVVYKKQRVHGFFRTLTIIALVVIGFLMLMEALNIFSLNINGVKLNIIYPIFIIFSSIVIWSYRGLFGKIFGLILFLGVVVGFFSIGVYTSLNPTTATKLGTTVSYPMISVMPQYSKLYIYTLISDFTFNGVKTNNFLDGNYGSDRKLILLSGSKDNFQYYSIKEETNLNLLQNYYSIVSLGVNSQQPLHLYVNNLLALQKIDLSGTKTRTAKIHAGAMISDITVGSETQQLDIESALSDIKVHLPKGVGVKLTYKDIIGKTDLSLFDQTGPGTFESKNIATAKKIVTITMRLGAARVAILWNE